jgi:hypothetical protein
MYVLVGTCRIAGTVYLCLTPDADSPGTKPLSIFQLEDDFSETTRISSYVR